MNENNLDLILQAYKKGYDEGWSEGWSERNTLKTYEAEKPSQKFDPVLTLDKDKLKMLFDLCGTVAAWDFNTSLGDTIREKYESLYVKLVELSSVVHRKSLHSPNFIITSPEIASIFETATAGFAPHYPASQVMPYDDKIIKVGTICSRWYLYKTTLVDMDKMLLGHTNDNMITVNADYLSRLTISNFII